MPDACVSAAAPGLPSAKMPPALEDHLDNLQTRAFGLEKVAEALRLMIYVDQMDRDLLAGVVGFLVSEASAIEQGLDRAELHKLPA